MLILANNTNYPGVTSVVLTGVAIVFGMLILFVLIISMFGLFSKSKSTTEVKEKPAKVKPVKAVPAPKKAAPVAAVDDDEIIAVISAAVYSMYEGTGRKPIIRSIRPATRVGRSAWATAGLLNNVKSF